MAKTEPELYILIGNTLEHSHSAAFFNAKFKQEGIDAVYKNCEIKQIQDFPAIIQNYSNLCGINVTSPYKQSVIPFLNDLDSSAQEAGAVNAIKVCNKRLTGFNTDVWGFEKLWENNITTQVHSVLILGSGGASKAVQVVLKSKNINFVVASRKTNTYSQIDEKTFDVIINATPLGMYPDCETVPPVHTDKIHSSQIVIDLIYNPKQTRLLRVATVQGAKTINGEQMFESQALKSWYIWANG